MIELIKNNQILIMIVSFISAIITTIFHTVYTIDRKEKLRVLNEELETLRDDYHFIYKYLASSKDERDKVKSDLEMMVATLPVYKSLISGLRLQIIKFIESNNNG